MGHREDRIADNETRFRDANEELRSSWEQLEPGGVRYVAFLCECGDLSCRQLIRLTLSEYEAVRSDASTFALVPGHHDKATEQVVTEAVVDRNERFAVVKKRPPQREVTEESDKRR